MANRYWVGGSGTWNTTSTTNWSASSGGASGASVPTAADSVFFDQAATYTVTMTGALTCLDITVSAGTVTFATGTTPTLAISGSWSTTSATVWSMTGAVTFNATTTGKTISTGGITINSPFTFNGAGGAWTLSSNLTLASTLTTTLTQGTLALSTFTLTTGLFSCTGTSTRTLNFGTGKIVLNYGDVSTSATVWNSGTITGLTVSGTSLVECIGGGGTTTAITKTISTGGTNQATSYFSFSLLETTGTAAQKTYAFTNGVKNLTVNGVQNTSGNISTYGNFVYNTTNGSGSFTSGYLLFSATSGTQTITTNAQTLVNCNVEVNGAGGTVQVADSLTLTTNFNLRLVNGTFDFNNKTVSGGGIVILTPGSTLANTGGTGVSLTQPIIHTSGTLALPFNLTTTGNYTFTAGTVTLNSYTLNVNTFSSSNTNVRTLDFGTGQLILTGNNATIFDLSTAGINFSVTGTVYITSTYTGATGTRTFDTTGLFYEAQANLFNVATSGTSGIVLGTSATDTVALTGKFNNVDLSGFTNTLSNTSRTIYGDLTLPASGGTFTAGATTTIFAGTSGTKTITSNGRSLNFPFTFNGIGGTWKLADAFTIGSTRTLQQSNGTLDLNGKTLTVGTYSTGAGTKNLTFNGGTVVCVASGSSFNNGSSTGYTTTAGTGTGKISMTAATAKTFNGGSGSTTFNCTLSNDGAGAMTIVGSSTFDTITNGVKPATFTFTAGTTTTVTNWNISGSAGNLVTIGSATAATHTLSKSTGTVSSDYLSISYSTATGGAAWYAGANSTNGGNNSGWIFTAPPVSSGNFLMMF